MYSGCSAGSHRDTHSLTYVSSSFYILFLYFSVMLSCDRLSRLPIHFLTYAKHISLYHIIVYSNGSCTSCVPLYTKPLVADMSPTPCHSTQSHLSLIRHLLPLYTEPLVTDMSPYTVPLYTKPLITDMSPTPCHSTQSRLSLICPLHCATLHRAACH